MSSMRCLVGVITLIEGLAMGMQQPSRVSQVKDSFAVLPRGAIVSLPQESDPVAQRSSPRHSSSSFFQQKRDVRPSFVGFQDNKCTSEISGYYLPAEPDMSGSKCTKVQHRNDDIRKAMSKVNKEMSMTWDCAKDWKTLMVTLHFGTNCSGGDDDTMKLTVNDASFFHFRNGGCVAALNKQSASTEYIRVPNAANIAQWPQCVQDTTYSVLTAVGVSLGLVFFFVFSYWLYRKYSGNRHSKQMHGMQHGHHGHGDWGHQGQPLMAGKGPAHFGKGKEGMHDAGKGKHGGDHGKGKHAAEGKGKHGGKFKGKDGQWHYPVAEAPPVVEAPPPPKPGPVDIKVTIVGASGLRKADVTGASDPFCECEILGKTKSKFKTPIIKSNLNPVWDHSGQCKDFDEDDKLQFVVYDDDLGGTKRDLLGKVTLKYKQVWPDGIAGEFPLEEAGDAKDAKLKVKVEIIHETVLGLPTLEKK